MTLKCSNRATGSTSFNELTSSNKLSNCIQDKNLKQNAKNWLKTFNNVMITNRKQTNENVHTLICWMRI